MDGYNCLHEEYVQMLQESLIHFFSKRPYLKIIKTSELTEYGNKLNEDSEFVKQQRYINNRKDKTWKLSYILNEYMDCDDEKKNEYIQSFLSAYPDEEFICKTSTNPEKVILFIDENKPTYPLFFLSNDQAYLYDLEKNHQHWNQLIEVNSDLKIKSNILNELLKEKLNILTDISKYIECHDTKYSLVEKTNSIQLKSLCEQYEKLELNLEIVIYELFSIIQLEHQKGYSLSKNDYDAYYADYESLDSISNIISTLVSQENIESERVLEELKKEMFRTFPFEVHESLVNDLDLFEYYFNQYIKEFIYRKKESIYLREKISSIDEIDYNDKGKQYDENHYVNQASFEYYQNQKNEVEYNQIDFQSIDLSSYSTMQIEKNILQFLKEPKWIEYFIQELTLTLYKNSLTAQKKLNKHGSAYNYAMYLLRMMQKLVLKDSINQNEEEFVKMVKEIGEKVIANQLMEKLNIKNNDMMKLLFEMIDSVEHASDKKQNRYDSISRARNHKENFKQQLIEILLYVQAKRNYEEKLEDLINDDLYTDISYMCYLDDDVTSESFFNEYIITLLKLLENDCEVENYEMKFLIYAMYLKYKKVYKTDISSFVRKYPFISREIILKSIMGKRKLIGYKDILEEDFEVPITVEDMDEIERYMIQNNCLVKAEYAIIREMR